ncbi:MAG: UPF0280 family protein [Burkholderiaceae bacterium]
MNAVQRAGLPGGRWHFQHGPIDCVIGAEGEALAVAHALDVTWVRFQGVLVELVAELPALRANLGAGEGKDVAGPIARSMVAACRPYADQGLFVTAMAAVAGSVAQDLIGHFVRPGVRRAYVNNGGDIALHLAAGEAFDIGLVIDPGHAGCGVDGQFRIDAASGVRGVATSGWRGRSLSRGIADSVTVLAATAAQADAAATMIANAVNVDDVRIVRAPADSVRDASDLGELLVTLDVPALPASLVAQALAAGAAFADREIAAGRVLAAALCLQGQVRRCAALHPAGHAPVSPILRGARTNPAAGPGLYNMAQELT